MMAFFGINSDMPKDEQLADIIAFADGAVAAENESGILSPFYGDNVKFKTAQADGIDESKLKNPIFSGLAGNLKNYVTKGTKAIGHIVKSQVKAKK